MNMVNRDAVFRVMKGVYAIIHTASLHHPHLTTHSRQDFIDTNITGTLNVLEAAVHVGVQMENVLPSGQVWPPDVSTCSPT